jgi:hypothetical protein
MRAVLALSAPSLTPTPPTDKTVAGYSTDAYSNLLVPDMILCSRMAWDLTPAGLKPGIRL